MTRISSSLQDALSIVVATIVATGRRQRWLLLFGKQRHYCFFWILLWVGLVGNRLWASLRLSIVYHTTSQSHHTTERKNVISMSLYIQSNHTARRYTTGALANAHLLSVFYPGWELWIYHDDSIDDSLLQRLVQTSSDVRLIEMNRSQLSNPMEWRFLALSQSKADRVLVRDVDSRLSARERAAVHEWITSDDSKLFHNMRDHPSHKHPINGGMWGSTYSFSSTLQLEPILRDPTRRQNTRYFADMDVLKKHVWKPYLQPQKWWWWWSRTNNRMMIQHDSYHCGRSHTFGPSRGFPTRRIGREHVGSVYDGHGRMSEADMMAIDRDQDPCPLLQTTTTKNVYSNLHSNSWSWKPVPERKCLDTTGGRTISRLPPTTVVPTTTDSEFGPALTALAASPDVVRLLELVDSNDTTATSHVWDILGGLAAKSDCVKRNSNHVCCRSHVATNARRVPLRMDKDSSAPSRNDPVFFVEYDTSLKNACDVHTPDVLVLVGSSRDYSFQQLQSECPTLHHLVLADGMTRTQAWIRTRPELFIEVARSLSRDAWQWSIFRVAASNIGSVPPR